MNRTVFYLSSVAPALLAAGDYLARRGENVTYEPSRDVTHLVLNVPSFDPSGLLKGGIHPEDVLSQLPNNVAVIGGNLEQACLSGRPCIDLLSDPQYLAINAAITADCAIRIAAANLPVVLSSCPMLIIGWGRIGKCLACKLKSAGAEVTVAARKETDRATVLSLGMLSRNTENLDFGLSHYRVIFNTVPVPVLTARQTGNCRKDCIKIDLASRQGILCDDVIWARGLPGKDAPESSGKLIAKTILRLTEGKEHFL